MSATPKKETPPGKAALKLTFTAPNQTTFAPSVKIGGAQ